VPWDHSWGFSGREWAAGKSRADQVKGKVDQAAKASITLPLEPAAKNNIQMWGSGRSGGANPESFASQNSNVVLCRSLQRASPTALPGAAHRGHRCCLGRGRPKAAAGLGSPSNEGHGALQPRHPPAAIPMATRTSGYTAKIGGCLIRSVAKTWPH
jgi:hypothetical protein